MSLPFLPLALSLSKGGFTQPGFAKLSPNGSDL